MRRERTTRNEKDRMELDGPNATRSIVFLVPSSLKRSLTWELEGTTICRSGQFAGEKHVGENLEQEVPRGPQHQESSQARTKRLHQSIIAVR